MIETNRIEFKRELTRELDIEKEVVAFLNYREGGIVYIGVDDNGQPVENKNIDGDMLSIKNRLRDNIMPSPMGLFDVTTEKKDASLTRKRLAEALEMTQDQIKWHLQMLQETGYLHRVGGRKEGHWEIIE